MRRGLCRERRRSMKNLVTLLLGAALAAIAIPAQAQTDTHDPAVEAPIRQFSDSFNKGDLAGAKATMTEDATIIDSFAPYVWRGTTAFDMWIAGAGADAAGRGNTEE